MPRSQRKCCPTPRGHAVPHAAGCPNAHPGTPLHAVTAETLPDGTGRKSVGDVGPDFPAALWQDGDLGGEAGEGS